ncbi:hypothetical protein [Helicobacter sp. WB40]|uniref:hypothetical protein n=1 Tax=Helicobacter sp. WB40 TaxID=3004130 RepID=UPI0022EC00D2|nr:hypothetical protein [Helicobacter sp. WB40]MDA3966645.1 hypothetical protein [Helicobacter sp. WB40]
MEKLTLDFINFMRGNKFDKLTNCHSCSTQFEIPYKLNEVIKYECKCGATYEITAKNVHAVTIKEV